MGVEELASNPKPPSPKQVTIYLEYILEYMQNVHGYSFPVKNQDQPTVA